MTDFTTITEAEIVPEESHFTETHTFTAGQSLASALQSVVQGSHAPGSKKQRIKDIFTRKVPTGKEVDVTMSLTFKMRDVT